MSISIYDPARPSNLNVAGQIGGLFVNMFGAASQWRDVRRTEKALSDLTDRELDDIGLTRADIHRAARRRR